MKKLLFLLLSLSFINTLLATTYYVSIATGNDSNSGTTESSPFKTVGKVASLPPLPGDSLLFKRGEQWKGVRWYFDESGIPAAPIYIGAYSTGERPILSNIDTLTRTSNPANWTFVNGLWEIDLMTSQSPGRLFLDGEEVLRANIQAEVGVPDSEGITAKWYFQNPKLYVSDTQNPAIAYNNIEGSSNYYTMLCFKSDYIIFEGIEIRGGNGPGLWLNNSNFDSLRHCSFGADGESGVLFSDTCSMSIIDSCTFDSRFTFYYGLGSARGCGDGVRLTNAASNIQVLNSTFKNWAHNAVELLQRFPNQLGTNYNLIRGNHIAAPDIPYAHPFGADGPLGKCKKNEFSYNRIEQFRTAMQINGDSNWVHHNVITEIRKSPSKNSATAHAFIIAVYDDFAVGNVCRDNIFENNLIMDADESAFLIRGYGYDSVVQNITIRNNIILDTGKSPFNNAYQMGTAIIVGDNHEVGKVIIENNLFNHTLVNPPILHRTTSNDYLAIEPFNLLMDSLGLWVTSNLEATPNLDALFHPLDNSPCVNAGRPTANTPSIDFYQQPRIIDGKIDIGPVENQNSCNPRVVIYVDAAATGTATGLDWLNAKTTIPAAISVCPNASERQIWTAHGTYFPTTGTDRSLSFQLSDSMQLIGGFTGNEFDPKDRLVPIIPTVLSGDIGVINDTSDNTYHIIYQYKDSAISYDGFSIEHGNALDFGGGVFLDSASVDFINCQIQNNYANTAAGLFTRNTFAQMNNCLLQSNISDTGYSIILDGDSNLEFIQSVLQEDVLNEGQLLLRNVKFEFNGQMPELRNRGAISIEDEVELFKN